MAQTESINPVELEKSQNTAELIELQQADDKKKKEQGPVDPLIVAYMQIFKSVQVNHETAGIQAKEIQANANAQNNLINEEAMINFSTVSQSEIDALKKSKRNTFLQAISTQNQEISALRNDIEDKLTVMKQDAQVSETNVNTVMNENQQSISQGSSLLNMLGSLTQQISQI